MHLVAEEKVDEGQRDRQTNGQLGNYVRKATTFRGLLSARQLTPLHPLPEGTYQFTQQQQITLQTTNQTAA